MKVVYRIVAVIALVGIIFTFIGAKDKIERSKTPINMAEVNWSDLREGDRIIITIDAVWSRVYKDFMTEEDSEALIAEYETTGRGYIIPRVHESDLGYRYADYVIGIKTNNESQFQVLDKIMGETYEWYYDDTKTVGRGITTLYFEGYLREMTDEEVAYFTEYLRNVCGYSDDQIASKLCPFMMETKEAGFGGVFLTIGLILDVIAVGLLAYAMIQNRKGNAIFGKSEYSEVVLHESADNKEKKAKPEKSIGKVKADKSSKKAKSSKAKNSIDIDSGAGEVFIEPVKKSSYVAKSKEKTSTYKESDNFLSISSIEESGSYADSNFYIDSKEESKSQTKSSFYIDSKESEEEISPLKRKFADAFAKKETVDYVDNNSNIEKNVDEITETYAESKHEEESVKESTESYVEQSVNKETDSLNTSSSSYGGSLGGNTGGSYGGNLAGSYGGNSGGAYGGSLSGGAYGGSLGGSYGGNSGGAYGGSLSGGAYGGGLGGSYGGNSGGAYGGSLSGGAYGGSLGGAYGGSLGGGYGGSLGGGYGGSLGGGYGDSYGGGYGGSLGGGYGGSLGGGYGGSLGGGAYGGSGGSYSGSGGSGYGGNGYSDSMRERERGFLGAGNQDSSGSGLKQGGVFDDFWKSLE